MNLNSLSYSLQHFFCCNNQSCNDWSQLGVCSMEYGTCYNMICDVSVDLSICPMSCQSYQGGSRHHCFSAVWSMTITPASALHVCLLCTLAVITNPHLLHLVKSHTNCNSVRPGMFQSLSFRSWSRTCLLRVWNANILSECVDEITRGIGWSCAGMPENFEVL